MPRYSRRSDIPRCRRHLRIVRPEDSHHYSWRPDIPKWLARTVFIGIAGGLIFLSYWNGANTRVAFLFRMAVIGIVALLVIASFHRIEQKQKQQ